MKKILFFAVLIFCLLGTTQKAYSYFDDSSITILNEDGELYIINETSNTTKKHLIPTGCILGDNDTYYVTYQYEVYIEKGINVESLVKNIVLEGSTLTDIELEQLFNFDITIDHVKDVTLSQGMFMDTTDGELLHITIEVTMNNMYYLNNSSTTFGHNLTFTYLLTVSKPLS